MGFAILIVDDSIGTRVKLRYALEGEEIRCVEACDGVQALALMGTDDFDLVITDQWMPNMTGVELIIAIRKDARYAKLPVLAVTADKDDEAFDEFAKAGATKCLEKPFSDDELVSSVLDLLRG